MTMPNPTRSMKIVMKMTSSGERFMDLVSDLWIFVFGICLVTDLETQTSHIKLSDSKCRRFATGTFRRLTLVRSNMPTLELPPRQFRKRRTNNYAPKMFVYFHFADSDNCLRVLRDGANQQAGRWARNYLYGFDAEASHPSARS